MDLVPDLQFRWRAARYELDTVSPNRARQLFVDIAGNDLSARSFHTDQHPAVRPVADDITHLIGLQSLKGSSYCLIWGVSLSFVPRAWASEIRWHRTPESARFDLFEAPAMAEDLPDSQFDSVSANGLHGEGLLQKDLGRLWRAARNEIFAWLDGVTTVEAVLETARAQQPGRNSHSPSPGLIEAFALGRLGYEAEGRDRLDVIIDEYGELLEPVDGLRSAFSSVVKSASQ
jgi:hypothetical protein